MAEIQALLATRSDDQCDWWEEPELVERYREVEDSLYKLRRAASIMYIQTGAVAFGNEV